jgi:hypothetical protein
VAFGMLISVIYFLDANNRAAKIAGAPYFSFRLQKILDNDKLPERLTGDPRAEILTKKILKRLLYLQYAKQKIKELL